MVHGILNTTSQYYRTLFMQKEGQRLKPVANFTNPFTQKAYAQLQAIWNKRRCSVSPTRIRLTLQVHTTRSDNQQLHQITSFLKMTKNLNVNKIYFSTNFHEMLIQSCNNPYTSQVKISANFVLEILPISRRTDIENHPVEFTTNNYTRCKKSHKSNGAIDNFRLLQLNFKIAIKAFFMKS